MTTTLEKPISTSTEYLPQAIVDFVHESIQSMDEKQLRAWKRESAKIMRKAKHQVAAASPATASRPPVRRAVRPSAVETRRVKSGVR
jgi:hypothetical protein